MNKTLLELNVERTIGKAEWKRIHASTRFNARIQNELETSPLEDGEETFSPSPETYSRTAKKMSLLAIIHREVDPIIQARKEAKQALYRGKDDFWRIPATRTKQPVCQAEADAMSIEEATENAKAIRTPVMQEQDVCPHLFKEE
jgi:hypothetical protein